jgi:eukaryotic-like serine/threonine-protein kinase
MQANPSSQSGADFSAPIDSSFARLREMFAEVSDLPASDRDAWIAAQVVDGDDREALRRLLAADSGDEGFLDISADRHAASMEIDESLRPGLMLGQRIGPFKLTRLLGKGGMAIVFLGERDDSDFVQRVAVKLLRRGLFSEIEQRLFRRERQLLAGLDHPNISRLIDGGITSAGVPYLVIEFVDGSPITQYATERRLSVRERLQLFLVVCRATESAHRALIVHRDIKPNNILVSADGTVKLLDFGIAKLLDDDVSQPTIGVFTPDYAAPEQLANLPITTATDVYALGILLYELLLGSRPNGTPSRRPSSLLKCLESDPQLRYASAGALADDVARHLDGKPVEAHPPSRWYRTRKFVKRHRGSVAITVLLVISIFAALAIAIWQANVARHDAARAREVQGFVESLFQPLQDGTPRDKTPTVMELLQRGLDRVGTSFHDDKRAQAELLAMFARINESIGRVKENRDLAEKAWKLNAEVYGDSDLRTLRARQLHARLLGDLNEDDASQSELTAVQSAMQRAGIRGVTYARLLDDLSSLRMDQGASDDEIIALRKQALDEREHDANASEDDISSGYNNLGIAYDRASQWDPAEFWYKKAYDTDMQTRGETFATAIDLGNVGNIQYWTGRWRESVATLTAARAIYQRVGIDNHSNVLSLLIRTCDEQAQLESGGAIATCNEAVAMADHIFGSAHPTFAMALMRRAGAFIAFGDFASASADLAQAREILATAQGNPRGLQRIADVTQSTLDHALGDDAALREHLKSITKEKEKPASASAPRIYPWFALACLRAPGDGCSDHSVPLALEMLDDEQFAKHPNRLAGSIAMADIEISRGDATAAIQRIEAALAVTRAELGDSHSWIGEADIALGDAQIALGNPLAARDNYRAAAVILQKLPATHPLRMKAGARLHAARN